ncbi:MAG TPA: hypothetical protein VE076_11150 [Nitrososphaeraceae archaeon]|nr:hypothetical protein [Nitrososphaeraceae archaeon]
MIDQTPICKQVLPLLRLKKTLFLVGVNEEYGDGQKGRPRFSFK